MRRRARDAKLRSRRRRRARWPRISIPMIGVIALLAIFVGYPIYIYVDEAISGGIHRAGNSYAVELKAMSSFALDQVNGTDDEIPKRFRDLDGKSVILCGEMYAPLNAGSSVQRFQLVYSIARCCFLGPPQVQHFVGATVKSGNSVEYHNGLVRVSGTLHVGVQRNETGVQSVYRLDVERVEPY